MSTAPKDAAALSGEKTADQLGQLRAVHEALQRFVAQRGATTGDPSGKLAAGAEKAALLEQVAELRARNEALERQLQAAKAQATDRPAAAEQLSAADRTSLAELRSVNESLRGQLAEARATEEQLRSSTTHGQFERQAMLGELHVLRCRSMELAEELSRERQHALAERQLWHNELSHWRRLLESHFVRLSGARVPPDPRTVTGLDLATPGAEEALTSILQMIEHHPQSDS